MGRALVVAVVLAAACTAGSVEYVTLIPHIGVPRSRVCDGQCTDRQYVEKLTAEELCELAIWRAGRGNCTCGYALINACGMRDTAVRERRIREPAMRQCMDPLSEPMRRELRIASTQPGVIAACVGDE